VKIIEEFLNRNNLNDIPIVQHCDNAFFILKSVFMTESNNYILIDIKWNDKQKGPGNYIIQFKSFKKFNTDWYEFLKNKNYIDRNLIYKTLSSHIVEYDDYENFIFNYFDSLSLNYSSYITPSNQQDAYFMMWESFVYLFDSYFIYENSEVKEILWESLDVNNIADNRIKNIDKILKILYNKFYSLYCVWNADMLDMANNYANWIDKLFHNLNLKKMIHI
jgi:hypothetical protein